MLPALRLRTYTPDCPSVVNEPASGRVFLKKFFHFYVSANFIDYNFSITSKVEKVRGRNDAQSEFHGPSKIGRDYRRR